MPETPSQGSEISQMPEMFDIGTHHRAKIGFVLLATEQTIEDDMFRLCPDGVGLHFTRAANPDSITIKTFNEQLPDLSRAASTLLPDGSLDVICYACTSGSIVMGEARIFDALSKGAPYARPTSLITSVMAALRAVGAERIAVATPYLDEINKTEAEYLTANGFDVLAIEGLNLEKDSDMVRVRPEFLYEFAASVDQPDADALFISCGALRSLEIVDRLEQKLGKHVICSNQAMAWHCLRQSGISDVIPGFGRLLREH
ncbi:arylmalonate decarboxylase [Alphaproteobacteria bacterium LSUCC0684]